MINSSKHSSAAECAERIESLLLDRDRARNDSNLRLVAEIDIELAGAELAMAKHISRDIVVAFKAGGKPGDENIEALKRHHDQLVYLSGERLGRADRILQNYTRPNQ